MKKQVISIRLRELILLFIKKLIFTIPLRRKKEVYDKHKLSLDGFMKAGITKINIENSVEIADYLNENYYNRNCKFLRKELINKDLIQAGRDFCYYVSFEDEKLNSLLFDEDLIDIVEYYTGRTMYYRNFPLLTRHVTKLIQSNSHQSKYHIDGGLRQISVIMLLNDLTEDDIHTEYALKSNKWFNFSNDRFRFEDADIEHKFKIGRIIGKKGDVFLFDPGNGYHRAVYNSNSDRRILHLNFTSGHSIDKSLKVDKKLNRKVLNKLK